MSSQWQWYSKDPKKEVRMQETAFEAEGEDGVAWMNQLVWQYCLW